MVYLELLRLKNLSALLVLAALMAPLAIAATTPTLSGMNGTHRTYSAKSLGHGKMVIGISGEGSQDEKKINDGVVYHHGFFAGLDSIEGETEITELIDMTARFFLSFGISNYFDIGMAMPIHWDNITELDAMGHRDLENISAVGFGDLEILGKLQYPPYEHDKTFEMALMGIITIPTGDQAKGFIPKEIYYIPKEDARETRFWSAQLPSVTLMMLTTLDFKEINRNIPLEWNLNFGLQATTSEHLDNSFLLSTSLAYQPTDLVIGFIEFNGQTRMSKFEDSYNLGEDPLIGSIGFALITPNGMTFSIALDKSLSTNKNLSTLRIDSDPGPRQFDPLCPNCDGDGKYTTYQVNPVANLGISAVLAWNGFIVKQDADKDKIEDNIDACPKDPEDFDGFEDHDGCPEPDNDGDGVCDPWVAEKGMSDFYAHICKATDQCPMEAEDLDGFEDTDGCPEKDNDKDGIPDAQDKCPDQPEDINGFQDEDGCPDAGNDFDGDGVPDVADKCPDDPEDKDGFEDEDGCPDPDNDKDGFCDPWVSEKGLSAKYEAICKATDKCPDDAENINEFEDDDGCPDIKPAPKPVIEKKAKIVLHGVNFTSGSADLTDDSFAKLDEVATTLKENADVVIEIRGYTDNRGSNSANMKLSKSRAESVVRYLLSVGVPPQQLKAQGFGPQHPVASNQTAEGRKENRRIEMYRVK
jgi:outer membrane protein OmpA-like peptidoglycan-associated protein